MSAAPLLPRVAALPPGCGLSSVERDLLKALAWFADNGVEDPPQDWLAWWTDKSERQVRRLVGALVSAGWLVADVGRSAEGRRRRTRYDLSGGRLAENLNGCDAPWTEELARRALARSALSGVSKPVNGAVDNAPPPDMEGQNLPPVSGGPPDMEGRNLPPVSGGAYRVRGGARARLSLYSISLSYAFRDAAQQSAMERIVAVCGVGLADPQQCEGLTESLAKVLDDWLARFDLDADIIPCIRRLTSYPRPRPVFDFGVFDRQGDSDLQRHRDARLAREKRRAEQAAKPKASKGFERAADGGDELDRMLARHRRAEAFRQDQEDGDGGW